MLHGRGFLRINQGSRCRCSGAAAVLIITAALLRCGGVTESAIAQDSGFVVATPESVGLSSASLDELRAVVDDYLERDFIVGAELLVIQDRKVVLHEAFGMRDRETESPWVTDTICNIRSMTKPLTGAAAQILIDRGELSLDDPVSKYLPSFDTDASRTITVRHVLTHRSGLPLSIMLRPEDMTKYDSLMEQANAVGENGPEFEIDSKFWYSDAGSDVVAAIVETVSGMTIDEFWQKELFDPLGMNDTFVGMSGDDPRFDRIASLYFGGANAWSRFWTPADGEAFYPFAWGSQTVYSTPADYARFLAMWMDRGRVGETQMLTPEAIDRTFTPVSRMSMLGSDEPYPTEFSRLSLYYGQMAMVYMPASSEDKESAKPVVIGHGGSDGTGAWAWPERDLMVLYFTQSRGGLTVLRIEEAIDRLLIHAGEEIAEEPVPERFAPYLGTYIANFASFRNEEFEVRMHNGKLALDIPSQMVFDLIEPAEGSNDGWKFAVAPNQVTVRFERNDAGEVDLLTIEQAGMVFEVPRAGTARADELAEAPTVEPEEVRAFIGEYFHPERNANVEVVLENDVLCLRTPAPQRLTFHFRKNREGDRWHLVQMPMIEFTFDRDDEGKIVSMTRYYNDEALVMNRVSEEEPGSVGPPADDEGGS